jgi:hypothetical protein
MVEDTFTILPASDFLSNGKNSLIAINGPKKLESKIDLI